MDSLLKENNECELSMIYPVRLGGFGWKGECGLAG